MFRQTIRFFALFGFTLVALARVAAAEPKQNWVDQDSGCRASLRGIAAVNADVCWASGSGGTVLRTVDGGRTWLAAGPRDVSAADFRDIEAFDENRAIVMSSGDVDRIYTTADGGQNWNLAFEHPRTEAFFDGMAFSDQGHGWLMGDPIDGNLLIMTTQDGGMSWAPLSADHCPKIDDGEAGFAASGTNLATFGDRKVVIALGGAKPDQHFHDSHLAITIDGGNSWSRQTVAIARGPSSGIFSICLIDDSNWVAVGGDYLKPDATEGTFAATRDGGETWTAGIDASSRPSGYRSAISRGVNGDGQTFLVCVGPNGTDWSLDLGKTWKRISETGFHAIDFSPDGAAGWAAGSEGRIGKWLAPKQP